MEKLEKLYASLEKQDARLAILERMMVELFSDNVK